jgi:aspartate/methionine/tyrosine aminotransferase
MNELALALNRTLEGTVIAGLLSDFGRRIYFPKGIVAQSAEAGKHAKRLNATIGMATLAGEAMHLPSIKGRIQGLTPNEIFAYAGTAGSPLLREAWQREMLQKNPSLAGKSISRPAVVAGLTHGIALVADLFAGPGDTVLMPDMCWDNYRLIFEDRHQAKVRTFPFFDAGGGLDVAALERALRRYGAGKAIVLLNFPNNPTGYTPTSTEAEGILRVLAEQARAGKKILAVFDDAYFGLYYEEGLYRQSLFAEAAGMHENLLAVKVDGPTKEDLVWGFRIGFVTFAAGGLAAEQFEALEQKVMGTIRSSVSNSSQPAQNLLLKAMQDPNYGREKQEAFAELARRYRKARELTARTPPPLKALPFNSGYFMTFVLERGSAETLRRNLLMDRGVGTIAFQDRYLRVAYSSVDLEKLEELYAIIFEEARKLAQ